MSVSCASVSCEGDALNPLAYEFTPAPVKDAGLGEALEMAVQEHRSLELNNRLDWASEEDLHSVFAVLLPHFERLAIHMYGNNIVQKIVKRAAEWEVQVLADLFIGGIAGMSKDKYGCRVVQRLLERLKGERRLLLVSELTYECSLLHSQFASHVIVKVLETVHYSSLGFIVEFAGENPVELAVAEGGCRVLRKLLEVVPAETLQNVIWELALKAGQLIDTQYGNYVLQSILLLGQKLLFREISDTVQKELPVYMKSKYASPVVELCYRENPKLYFELVFGSSRIVEYSNDKYGNFIVQQGIKLANFKQKQCIRAILIPKLPLLTATPYGRYVAKCITSN